MNLFTYYSPDFYSQHAPACADGNTGETLRGGGVRWERALGFTSLENLHQGLRQLTSTGTVPIDRLGILCHGQPGGLRLLADNNIMRTGDLGRHGPSLRSISDVVVGSTSRRPTVIFLACAAAAQDQGMELFELISTWMRGAMVVGFTRLLVSAEVTPHELGDGNICLPPDLAVTEEEYNPGVGIAEQTGSISTPESSLPGASASSSRAVRFLAGRRLR